MLVVMLAEQLHCFVLFRVGNAFEGFLLFFVEQGQIIIAALAKTACQAVDDAQVHERFRAGQVQVAKCRLQKLQRQHASSLFRRALEPVKAADANGTLGLNIVCVFGVLRYVQGCCEDVVAESLHFALDRVDEPRMLHALENLRLSGATEETARPLYVAMNQQIPVCAVRGHFRLASSRGKRWFYSEIFFCSSCVSIVFVTGL